MKCKDIMFWGKKISTAIRSANHCWKIFLSPGKHQICGLEIFLSPRKVKKMAKFLEKNKVSEIS